MVRFTRFVIATCLLALLVAFSLVPALAQSQEETEQALIQIVAQSDEIAGWLDEHPGWIGHGYPGEDAPTFWYVEFYDSSETEWLGYGVIHAETGEIIEAFAPRPLPTEVYAEQQPRIQTLVLADPEVQARLIDPALWDVYTDYNRWEAVWEVYLYRGQQALLVKASLDENDYFSISSITDPNELAEEQAAQAKRDQAVNLAYSAEGIDAALEGYDNWKTYVENQGGTRWSVSFEADGQRLFYALVDIATNRVLDTTPGS
ncbi:MAG: hypothetical protein HZC41_11225 [Chloroflexi bacterium]|nr:hypothetical protein [Chloroflexota bacterium]